MNTMQNLGGLWQGFNQNLGQTSQTISQTQLPTLKTDSVFRIAPSQILLIAGVVLGGFLLLRKRKR